MPSHSIFGSPEVRAGRARRTRGLGGLLTAAVLILGPTAHAEPIRGAGSTFAAPVISQWSRDYEAMRTDGGDYVSPDWQVDYEPVGSLAGIMRLEQPEMDFAATDAPLPSQELDKRGWTQFPIVMGGIAVVANLDGVESGQLRLSGPVLADIYSGRITRWADAAIRALNPDLVLPDTAIEVLHREDGSGSTLAFTRFLSQASDEWRERVGADTLIAWPRGRGERGTSDLSALAAATGNSITYLEFGQASRAGLPFVLLQNATGNFVRPSPEAFQAGLAPGAWDGGPDSPAKPPGPGGTDAYPMAVVTYAVLPKDRGQERVNRVLDLFRIAFEQGGEEAAALGYVPVSSKLAGQVEAYWTKNFGSLSN
ncbi:phosphate ABC transporter substrate-binding protein PstS [Marinivivus vitaminiproducens]|uniref:phosphate ABC transporter substrate-binding protein PstS n=1 Tax=Marinivivus vitaminiproducens TaxID=3035935 RepID=UPI0027A8E6E3|nr:phosphate ABC transporter substrate-binding protein PstS [Geminicoccaceae bacterium SCSIO 64248]